MNSTIFPVLFPASREFSNGDRFDIDCVRHHPVPPFRGFPGDGRIVPNWRALPVSNLVSGPVLDGETPVCAALSLLGKFRFPARV